jgi:hypothetical protein
LIISLSEKRLYRKGFTALKESGPPRFSKTTPTVSLFLLAKLNPDVSQIFCQVHLLKTCEYVFRGKRPKA